MPEGLLFVYSEPGDAVTTEEFNDWYDNEHVPLRLPVPGFQSWSRWVAVDGQHPAYVAIYDLASPSVVTDPAHAALADTRSEREKSIISRIALLDRRTYARRGPVVPPKGGDAAFDPAKPGPFACIVEIDVKPEAEDFNRWYDEEHIPMMAKVPGWIRSRRFVLVDAGAIGSDAGSAKPAKYCAIHDMEDPATLEREEFKAATETEWTKKSMGNATRFSARVFRLARSWKSEDQ
ncbi:hypothetical protein C8Q77DRAFT_1055871 [Trametes polyzona]|nr:hypothetical protein C8Q77DRAFT_1055871 [Trametes polyzona]